MFSGRWRGQPQFSGPGHLALRYPTQNRTHLSYIVFQSCQRKKNHWSPASHSMRALRLSFSSAVPCFSPSNDWEQELMHTKQATGLRRRLGSDPQLGLLFLSQPSPSIRETRPDEAQATLAYSRRKTHCLDVIRGFGIVRRVSCLRASHRRTR